MSQHGMDHLILAAVGIHGRRRSSSHNIGVDGGAICESLPRLWAVLMEVEVGLGRVRRWRPPEVGG